MSRSTTVPSSQLLEANQRLYELRAKARVQYRVVELPIEPMCQAVRRPPWDVVAPKKSNIIAQSIATLPDHLGWGSDALTAVLRRQQDKECVSDDPNWVAQLSATAVHGCPYKVDTSTPSSNPPQALVERPSPTWVKLYPHIGLAMLRQEMTAPGRLWLMLRYLDKEGSGLLRIDNLVQQTTPKSSSTYFCGKRQLRNLLQAGEGVFWTRDKEHIWLRSAAKVAYALEVEQLIGRPVALPITALLNGIGNFRAHLYAAFHSGRVRETPDGEQAMPIARETLAGLSGVGRSSQRAYEERVGLEVQANFAVGEVATKESWENLAWQRGQALFELKDYRGQQGKKGKTYLAWQLPNSYIGQHQQRPKGRQKRINRELRDLVMKGMPGNVEGVSETRQLEKLYYPNGKMAAKAYGRSSEQELYWKRHRTRNGRFAMWQQLGDA